MIINIFDTVLTQIGLCKFLQLLVKLQLTLPTDWQVQGQVGFAVTQPQFLAWLGL